MSIVADGHHPDDERDIGGRTAAGYSAEISKAAPMLRAFSGVIAGTATKPGEGFVPTMQTKAMMVTIQPNGFASGTFPEPFPRAVFAISIQNFYGIVPYVEGTSLTGFAMKGPAGIAAMTTIVAWGC